MPGRFRLLRRQYAGSFEKFLADFRSRIPGTKPHDVELIEVYAYVVSYSADQDGTVRMAFDEAGALVPEVWARWLAWDPVVMAAEAKNAEALSTLRAVWIDAGNHDEYHLDAGATAFHRAVTAAGLPAERIHFELFDAGHGGIEYRYPLAISWLAKHLSS